MNIWNLAKIFSLVIVVLAPFERECHAQATEKQQAHLDRAESAAVKIRTGISIRPENSRISFIGLHVGDDPKPRLGGFQKFDGFISVDMENKSIRDIQVKIDIASVWTEFEKLTTHLKNADFFDIEKFTEAKFVSSGIELQGAGKCHVKGKLTLHGQTREIAFPAKYRFASGGLLLKAKFEIDRAAFGMKKGLEGVEKMVTVDVSVGQPTQLPPSGK